MLKSTVPSDWNKTSILTKTKLDYQIDSKSKVNRVRVKAKLTVAGTAGTGTSVLSSLINTLRLYKGSSEEIKVASAVQKLEKIRLNLQNTSLLEAVRLGKARTNLSTRGHIFETDEVVDADGTHYLTLDILMNLPKGKYYAEVDLIASSNLAGFTTDATTAQFELMIMLIDEGIAFLGKDVVQIKQKVGHQINSEPCREVMVVIASGTAYTGCESFFFDQEYNQTSLEVLDEAGLARTGASGITVLYKASAELVKLLSTWTASTTAFVATVN